MNPGAYLRLSRPFTLLAPALGMIAGGVAALGYDGSFEAPAWAAGKIALGALCAALLNVASNTVNQIYDLEVDLIHAGRDGDQRRALLCRCHLYLVTSPVPRLESVVAAASRRSWGRRDRPHERFRARNPRRPCPAAGTARPQP